ncbi:STAS domain-containing protein [Streptomyces sp. NPDC059819]|uniref:STAS domain-containing protein n=1 Tax=Streptomyces sp. NPDC059819 TaxID=3346963 RepID=UPI00365D7D9A
MDTPITDQRMFLVTYHSADTVVLAVHGEVDLDSTQPLRLALDEAARYGAGPVVVDLSGVLFADTTIVNTLLRARSGLGERLRLAAPSWPVLRLLRILGMGSVFAIHTGRAAALRDGPVHV